MAGVRARHGQGAGRAGAVEAAHESYRDSLDRYVRAACVSLCRSESSHEDARVPHMRLCLGRLWDHSKQSFMSLFYPLPYYETDGQ